MYEIKHPEQTTYWIAYTNNEIFGYGICTPEQQMYSGQPFLWTTLSEEEWILELQTEFGVLYPDLPSGEVWGYQYNNEADGLIDVNALTEVGYTTALEYSTDYSFWYIVYQEGMQDVLGENPTHFQVSDN